MKEKTAKFTTPCENCVFAIWKCELSETVYQTGCELGRLTKFREKGLAETNKSSFIIQTICNAKRDQIWADQQENVKESVLRECQIQNDFIILSIDDDNLEAKLMQRAKQCINQTIKPRSIIFVIKSPEIPRLKELYWDLYHELNNTTEFYFVRIMNLDMDRLACIDEAFHKVRGAFYTVFNADNEIPLDYNEKLNRLLNIDLTPFVLVEDIGCTVLSRLHKMLKGSTDLPIKTKLLDIAKDQNLEHMILESL